MKKNRINTTSIREIKSSFKRFISLLIMSLLGVATFVGIKMSAPDMIKSLDKYYDNTNTYDIKVISTLGLTHNDLSEIKKIKNVKDIYGVYSKDVLSKINNEEVVLKVIGLNKDINKIIITKGSIPKSSNEILVEESVIDNENVKIGDYINIDDDYLIDKKYKIVGTVKSPLYITSNKSGTGRGNTNIATGKINYYTYVLNDAFDIDYFTEIYITVKDAKKQTTNSESYLDKIKNVKEDIEIIKIERQNARYKEIYDQAYSKIDELKNDNIKKLNRAKNLLDESKAKLDEGKLKLDDTDKMLKASLEKLNNNKKTLDEANEKLSINKVKLDEAKKQIDEGKSIINSELSIYNLSLEDINNAIDYFDNLTIPKENIINLIPDTISNYDEIIDAINKIYDMNLDKELKEFIKDPNNKDDLINKIPNDTIGYDVIVSSINYISNNANIIKDFIVSDEYIDNIISKLPNDTPLYDEIINMLNSVKEDKNNVIKLISAIKEINESTAKYEEGLMLYNSYLNEYNNGYELYTKYYNDYQNGLSLYNNGLSTYKSSLNLYNSKLKEYYYSKSMFDLKINEAFDKLDEIPKATWYIYDRLDDSNYSSFIDDGNSVSNLSKIFPTIFFVVAILISLISMSRMVEDDRGNIGILKSLGFSNKDIRKKYLLYSILATLIGGLLGALLGFFILPRYVWNIYKILFDVPCFAYDYNLYNVILGILIVVICICGTTLITIRKVVKEKPSDLMRPKAPVKGKRVFLEKIDFIWNKLNFSNKVTIRNLFRYKKRVIMTVVGIMGCTALMLSGFGIKDSIVTIPDKQYNDIFKFDEMIYITGDNSYEKLDNIFSNKHIIERLDVNINSSIMSDGYNVNILTFYNSNKLSNIINLKDVKTKNKLVIEDNKVLITDKLAELTNKKVNDKIILTDSNNNEYEFVISGICENYVGNYVFMNKPTYEKYIDKYSTNVSFLRIDNLKYEDKVLKELLSNESIISGVSVNQTISGVNNMLKSLNSVVAILIFLSGALSFVVLYNLSYINICERKREIATLKVLGFTNKEVDDYIVKETIILTIIGIILGIVFGIFLTNIILDTVEIDMVRFNRYIKPVSYIITSFLVMLFTIIVSIIIHFYLKKIDMIESLKSVE